MFFVSIFFNYFVLFFLIVVPICLLDNVNVIIKLILIIHPRNKKNYFSRKPLEFHYIGVSSTQKSRQITPVLRIIFKF